MQMKKTGIELIAEERHEQIEKHGRTVEKDITDNRFNQLTDAAIMILQTDRHKMTPPSFWNESVWNHMIDKKLKDRLIIAGALIAAEIDRLQAGDEYNNVAQL